jgi:hypothetical protein
MWVNFCDAVSAVLFQKLSCVLSKRYHATPGQKPLRQSAIKLFVQDFSALLITTGAVKSV